MDFADVKAIIRGAGNCLMGIGAGTGENRAVEAATKAISNPLLENASMEGAQGVLVNVTRGNDFSIHEYDEIVSLVTNSCEKEANIIAGMAVDPEIENEVRVTVIATGFNKPHLRTDDRIKRNGLSNIGSSFTKKLYPDEKPQSNVIVAKKNEEEQKSQNKKKSENVVIKEESIIKDFDDGTILDPNYTPDKYKPKKKIETDEDLDIYKIPALIRKRSD